MPTENPKHSGMGPRNSKKSTITSKHEWILILKNEQNLSPYPLQIVCILLLFRQGDKSAWLQFWPTLQGNSHVDWNYKTYHTVIHTEAVPLVLIPPCHTAQSRKSWKAENSPWQVGSWCWRWSLGRSSRLWRFMVAGNSAHPIPNAHVVQLPG